MCDHRTAQVDDEWKQNAVRRMRQALEAFRAGRRDEVDVVGMLELAELLRDAGEEYWAALAYEIASQAART